MAYAVGATRGVLRQQGQRVSRHYYDIYKLIPQRIHFSDRALALDCARHAQLFFNSTDLDEECGMGRLRSRHPL